MPAHGMSLFDGALFDSSVFHAGGIGSSLDVKGAGKGRKRGAVKKPRYAWKQKHSEFEKMISRRR